MMAQEFRYPLTRICLRSGTLTLPLAMLKVFPNDGAITVHDTLRGAELELSVDGREVSGLEHYFSSHDLEVNDEVVVKLLDDGGIGMTAVKRVRRPDFHRPEVLGRLIDEIVDAGVPMTEGEIRALHADIPSAFPLQQALERDARLTLHQGRWQSSLALEEERRAVERANEERRVAEAQRRAEVAAEAERRAEAAAKAAEQREAERRAEAAAKARAEREAELADEQAGSDVTAASGPERADAERERVAAQRAAAERASREALAARAEEDARAAAQRTRNARAEAQAEERRSANDSDDAEGPERFDWDEPVGRGFRFPWQRAKAKPAKAAAARETPVSKDPFQLDRLGEARPSSQRPTVVPTPRPGLFPGDTALNSASLPPGDPVKTKRAREVFAGLGYRVEGLAHGQLMLHADLGRRQHRVLLHVLPDEQRLDWAALLARRRESGATYLAVLGDHRDLHRLTAPADLARATLWSWAGVERVVELSTTVMLGPVDLEPHFERDGVFEYGLERFERSVAKRVQEKGVVSTVLTRLAEMRAPAVFVIEDLVSDAEVSRDQIVRVLERLADAPFHLISKVDNGEFCLRYRVHDALDQLSEYASSLRARLPERKRERVRGISGDELAAAFEPIGADDIGALTDAPADASPAAPQAPDAVRAVAPAWTATPARQAAPARPRSGSAAPGAGATADPSREPVPVAAPKRFRVETEAQSETVASERPAPRRQDALFGDGFGAGFDDDAGDDVDLSSAVDRKPNRQRRR